MRNDFCSNYLEHSAKGSTWKKGTKYISRVLKNGKWVYEYKVTGKGYKQDRQHHIEKAIRSSSNAEMALRVGGETGKKVAMEDSRDASYHGRKAAEAQSNYYTKSLAGNIERGTQKIASILKRLKSSTTETVKDTFTGETRKVNRSGETINVKQAAEKNKKVVSDDGKTKVTVSSNISPKKKKKK